MKIVINHIIISAEVVEDSGKKRPVNLIFKKEDLEHIPGLVQEMFSDAKRYLFHNADNTTPNQHPLPSQGRAGERS